MGQTLNILLCNAPPWPHSASDISALLLLSHDIFPSPVNLILNTAWLLINLSGKYLALLVGKMVSGYDGQREMKDEKPPPIAFAPPHDLLGYLPSPAST